MPHLALHGGPPVRREPFASWPSRSTATRRALVAAHGRSWWQDGTGPAEELESWLREQYDRPAVAVSSGTTALELALTALGIRPGAEVLVPATTFVSTASAVSRVGAVPVPVDVDPGTLTLDPAHAAASVTSRTEAVVPVHLAGHPADLTAVSALAARHGLALVEDSAQAVTAAWHATRVATTGDAAVLSFHAHKLLPGGDGGAVLFRDDQAARRAELLANCGRPRGSGSYDHLVTGTNARINVWTAALVLAHTGTLDQMWRTRDHQRRALAEALADAGHGRLLIGPHPAVTRHDHYAVLLRVPPCLEQHGIHAGAFAHALAAEGIPAKALFPPWQTTPAYRDQAAGSTQTPNAARAAEIIVALPHHLLLNPYMPAHTARALAKLARHGEELATWQDQHAPAGRPT